MRLVRSLWVRLSMVLLVLLLALGLMTLWSQLRLTNAYQAEVDQKLNRDLPGKIIASQGWAGKGLPTIAESEPLFHDLMMLNPNIELYILDTQGRVVGFSAEKPLLREQVDLEPIRRWLSGEAQLPVVADDPRGEGKKVFAAAELYGPSDEETPAGFLYIVLPSQLHDSARRMVEGSYMFRLAAGRTLTALVGALVLGWLLFYGLTGRLRRLADGMDAYRERGLVPESLRGDGRDSGGDELDRLRTSFVALADRVSEQIDELMRADVQRRELVAGISHDLRTPLTILRGYLETLQVKEDVLAAEERRRSLEAALRQAEHVSELVTQLFELATLDGNTLEVQREDFSIGELVQDVALKFSLRARQKGVAIETDHGTGLPFVVGDLRLVERVLDNLLDNALRHTPAGGTVTISCRKGGSRVRVEVADSGEGIAERDQARIFEPFYHSAAGGGGGAAGLGLAIVRRILELHGSTVEVESARGQGARFSFRLPIAVPSRPIPKPA